MVAGSITRHSDVLIVIDRGQRLLHDNSLLNCYPVVGLEANIWNLVAFKLFALT